MKKKIGSDIPQLKWILNAGGVSYNWADLIDLKVVARQSKRPDNSISPARSIKNGNELELYFNAADLELGRYYLEASFSFTDVTAPTGAVKSPIDWTDAFEIVQHSYQEDSDGSEFTTDIKFGVNGLSAYEAYKKYCIIEGIEYLSETQYLLGPATAYAAAAAANNAIQSLSQLEQSVTESENTRIQNEQNRVSAEELRQTAEGNRNQAEQSRVSAEELRDTAEGSRSQAEQSRVSAEELRDTAEGSRSQAEQSRASAEELRATAEGNRDQAEQSRASAEELRQTAEGNRNQAEQSRASAEELRDTAEGSRSQAEQSRASAEELRATAEENRDQAEQSRASAEELREQNTSTAINNANEKAALADEKAELAAVAAESADFSANNASEKAELAVIATSNANTAADNANTAAEVASFKTFGFTNFATYSALARLSATSSNYSVKGDFTVIKRFNANTYAVSSRFFILKNATDEISVDASGYTLTIKIKKDNIVIYTYSEATSILFPSSLGDILLFIEVDYTNNQIRFTRSGASTTYSIPELAQIKERVFSNIELGVNSFTRSCKFSFIISGHLNYSNAFHLFPVNGSTPVADCLLSNLKNINVNTSIRLAKPSSFWANCNKLFANGKVTYTYADVAAQSTGTNNYLQFLPMTSVDFTKTSATDSYIIHSFSLDVVSGTLSLSSVTPSNNLLFRAINKTTGEIIEYRNLITSTIINLPVGQYKILIYSEARWSSYGQNAVTYFIGFRGLTADGSFIVYDDYEMQNLAVILSALPTLSTYTQIYCPFTNQFLTAIISLSNTYYTT